MHSEKMKSCKEIKNVDASTWLPFTAASWVLSFVGFNLLLIILKSYVIKCHQSRGVKTVTLNKKSIEMSFSLSIMQQCIIVLPLPCN